jgi:hypothetical protein
LRWRCRENREVKAADGLAELVGRVAEDLEGAASAGLEKLPEHVAQIPNVREHRSRVGIRLVHDAGGRVPELL